VSPIFFSSSVDYFEFSMNFQNFQQSLAVTRRQRIKKSCVGTAKLKVYDNFFGTSYSYIQVLKPDAVRDTLSLLHSCGFYEYSGAFAFKVSIGSSIDKSISVAE
jgi:glutaminase